MRSPSIDTPEDPSSALFRVASSGRNPESIVSVEGLRMSDEAFLHQPVMLNEVVDLFAGVPTGVIVDATVGGGGHSAAILERYPHLVVLGIDQDADAVQAARARLAPFGARATVVRGRFDHLSELLAEKRALGISGVLFDLGVSSPQLDRGDRGFSFRNDGPLDMRMDVTRDLSAATVVNEYDERELVRIFADNGETRFGRRIARAIIAARPVSTTAELADIVKNAIPAAARRTGGHPARRVFQGIRVEVNQELEILAGAIDAAISELAPGGRAVVMSYQSGEDRIVKARFFEAVTGGCVCPPALPCVCGAVPTAELVSKGSRKPSAEEIVNNPRAESARLRALTKLEVQSQ